ncbi:MAG: HAD family hydrolase [Lachnospiraceae bacterium]
MRREGIRKKPAPDTVFQALRELGVEAQHAVYVGDSDVDLETAANAGMDVIPVCWGFRSREFLIEHGAVSERIVSNARSCVRQITGETDVQK